VLFLHVDNLMTKIDRKIRKNSMKDKDVYKRIVAIPAGKIAT
jgi:hypothetical protein